MSLPIIVSREAEADIVAAAAWYEKQDEGLGATFLERVEEALDEIAFMPGRFAPGRRNTRIAFVRKFPYFIIFREHPDHVIVVSVVHGRSGSSYLLGSP